MTEGVENTPEEDAAVAQAALEAAQRQEEYETNTHSFWALDPFGGISSCSEEGANQLLQYDGYICFQADLAATPEVEGG